MTGYSSSLDYGVFDSRFLGVTVRFRESGDFDPFKKLHLQESPPEEVLAVGERAVRMGGLEGFSLLSRASVVAHELRHFHDALLAPWSGHVFRLRVLATYYTLQLLSHLTRERNLLPIPISRWLDMGPSEIRDREERWSAWEGEEVDLTPPDWGEDVQELIDRIRGLYEKIDDLTSPVGAQDGDVSLRSSDVFEVSALLAQIQYVYTTFGEEQSSFYLNFLLNHPEAGTYSRPFRILQILFRRNERVLDSALALAMTTWSLLGSYEKDGWVASPAVRFVRLCDYLEETGLPDSHERGSELHARWSEALGYTGIADAVAGILGTHQLLQRGLERADENADNVPASLATTVVHRRRAAEHMARYLNISIGAYSHPLSYREELDRLVAAPVELEWRGVCPRIEGSGLEELVQVRRARETQDGQKALESGVLKADTPGVRFIDRRAAADAADLFRMADYLFADRGRDHPGLKVVRQVFDERGLRPRELWG